MQLDSAQSGETNNEKAITSTAAATVTAEARTTGRLAKMALKQHYSNGGCGSSSSIICGRSNKNEKMALQERRQQKGHWL